MDPSQNNPSSATEKKPWYRQPLVWLVIAFPAIAVVGGISLLILSINIDTGVVVDDYYKKGKEINMVLTRDKKAIELGIRGVSVYSSEQQRFSVTLASTEGENLQDQEIRLDLMHATRGGMDVSQVLDANGPGLYQADLAQQLAKGPWNVQVSTDDWRIHGRIHIPDGYTSPLSAQ
ncbi:MAG TPA: FixH family protein [Gammaproteobacteria bacterium]